MDDVRPYAASALHCPADQIVITVISQNWAPYSETLAVRGCGRHARCVAGSEGEVWIDGDVDQALLSDAPLPVAPVSPRGVP